MDVRKPFVGSFKLLLVFLLIFSLGMFSHFPASMSYAETGEEPEALDSTTITSEEGEKSAKTDSDPSSPSAPNDELEGWTCGTTDSNLILPTSPKDDLEEGQSATEDYIPVEGIGALMPIWSMAPGNTLELHYFISPEKATNQKVTWESSDETIATVDKNGLVTALAVGSVEIYTKTEDGGFTVTHGITVSEKTAELDEGTAMAPLEETNPQGSSGQDSLTRSPQEQSAAPAQDGAEKKTETQSTGTPQTGDVNNASAWAATLIVALLTMAFCTFFLYRKHANKR